ncbi:MAG TPA: hypothetical protein VE223_08120 [Nitrososphaeraceae archaeon]|nr:hypothetical protein [Nitrososphaeraceae archaeon]
MNKYAKPQFNKVKLALISLAFGMMMIIFFTITNNIVYTQKGPLEKSSNTTALSSPSSSHPKLHAVKITSPTKGQQVPTGKDLIIIGTSSDNATSFCQVLVIVNGVKPYQPATGTGHGGATDYSKWNYVLTSKYTTIKPGPNNKITAKYVCMDKPSVSSFYSVNLTGINVATSPDQSTKVNNNVTTTTQAANFR